MTGDVDPMDQWEEQPPDPSEQQDRDCVARALRSIRGQIRRMGESGVSRELMREWQMRAGLLQSFRKADRQIQQSGRKADRRAA